MEFSSEGFDLDAVGGGSAAAGNDVVYEIGGGVSRMEVKDETKEKDKQKANDVNVLKEADAFKEQGNAAFKAKNWKQAYELYTAAIDATPGMKGTEILELRQAFRQEEQKRARRALQAQEDARRRERDERLRQKKDTKSGAEETSDESTPSKENTVDVNGSNNKPTNGDDDEKKEFEAPPHEHGEKLAIYHCNRSAVLQQLERYDESLDDADLAVLLHPTYTKAYVRRAKTHELLEQYELAIADISKALELEPAASKVRPQYARTLQRLQTLDAKRTEQLKAETMDKLKDLGNSLLGNFGLSLDNFKAVQDPKTGSYSISFDQNASKPS